MGLVLPEAEGAVYPREKGSFPWAGSAMAVAWSGSTVPFSPSGNEVGWERAFWMMFRRSANPAALLDEERRFADVNEALTAQLGRSRIELLGTSMADLITPVERPKAAMLWDSFMLRGGEYTGRRRLIRSDGSLGEVEFAARMIPNLGRRLAVYVVLLTHGRWPEPAVLPPPPRPLTKREREVVTLIALGSETDDIGRALFISPETVRSHVRNAMAKLQAHTRAQLVAEALCRGLAVYPLPTEEVMGG